MPGKPGYYNSINKVSSGKTSSNFSYLRNATRRKNNNNNTTNNNKANNNKSRRNNNNSNNNKSRYSNNSNAEGLTVGQLKEKLEGVPNKTPVYHVEFGGLTRSHSAYLDDKNRFTIDSD